MEIKESETLLLGLIFKGLAVEILMGPESFPPPGIACPNPLLKPQDSGNKIKFRVWKLDPGLL